MVRRRHEFSCLDTIAFAAAIPLSLPICAAIDRAVGGPRDSPAMLFPYLCCGFLPCVLLTFWLAAALRGRSLARENGGGEASLDPRVTGRLMAVGVVVLVLGLGAMFALSGARESPQARPSDAAPQQTDPRARALALARRAIVARLSESGVQRMQLDARRIALGGEPLWRITSRGAVIEFVVDVPDDDVGTRVYRAGQAPPADPMPVEAPDGVAPVESS